MNAQIQHSVLKHCTLTMHATPQVMQYLGVNEVMPLMFNKCYSIRQISPTLLVFVQSIVLEILHPTDW
jgi:hypothetical protein